MSLPFDPSAFLIAAPRALALAGAFVIALVLLFTVVPAIRELRRRRRSDAWAERTAARFG